MRLGQFARKYDVRVQDIISYLGNDSEEIIHSNTKLSDADEADILEFFGISIEVSDEPIASIQDEVVEKLPEEQQEEHDAETSETSSTPMDDIASVEGEIELAKEPTKEKPEEKKEEPAVFKTGPNEDEVIQTDKLLELLESEEAPADLEKIKLIKAPKRELSGLKVLGKVDLPQPKQKPEKEEQESRKPKRRSERPKLTEEEREKRRLKAKQKKEAFEAREEKRRKEQEAQRLKELKAKHYKQKLQSKPQPKKKPASINKSKSDQLLVVNEAKPEPKTWLGKWWRWMNT